MTKRKTTPQERTEFLRQQRAKEGTTYGSGRQPDLPQDMSFIDGQGNIVHPSRRAYEKSKRRIYHGAEAYGGRYEGHKPQPPYRTLAFLGIGGVLAGLFFISANLTGNVIGSLNQPSSGLIGIVLFIAGLSMALIYSKRK
ncbi:MAG: hypothetical protein WCK90_01190 [archaeon]